MEIRRIFCETWYPDKDGVYGTCYGTVVTRMRKVLRLRPGDTVTLIVPQGRCLTIEIDAYSGKDSARVRILKSETPMPNFHPTVYLAMAWLKHDSNDSVILPATELGVFGFIPLETEHTLIRPRGHVLTRRLQRWCRIAAEGLESSGRALLPEIRSPMRPQDLPSQYPTGTPFLWLIEPSQKSNTIPLWEWVHAHDTGEKNLDNIVLVVGPEGGWSPKDFPEDMRSVVRVTLGSRVLRSPTAALAALSILLPIIQPKALVSTDDV